LHNKISDSFRLQKDKIIDLSVRDKKKKKYEIQNKQKQHKKNKIYNHFEFDSYQTFIHVSFVEIHFGIVHMMVAFDDSILNNIYLFIYLYKKKRKLTC
jgi:hypothetical protein